jgi:hypothetical protein
LQEFLRLVLFAKMKGLLLLKSRAPWILVPLLIEAPELAAIANFSFFSEKDGHPAKERLELKKDPLVHIVPIFRTGPNLLQAPARRPGTEHPGTNKRQRGGE